LTAEHAALIVLAEAMRSAASISIAALAILLAGAAWAGDQQLKIGVGTEGPISPQAAYQIEQIVAEMPNVKDVPIVPPGDQAAIVRRFVAGEADDRLDGVIILTLPPDSFKVERDAHEASFSGSYEIYTLDLSSLGEDRHVFMFSDSEPVTGGMTALLAIPAQLLAERTAGTKLISGNAWEAFQAVQVRIESKLVAATRMYLAKASIRNLHPLDRLECAQHLLDAGDADTAMAVFRSVGMDNPQVAAMLANANQRLKITRAETLLGRTLGALASGDAPAAATILASYEKEPAAQSARVAPIRRALSARETQVVNGAYNDVLGSDVPGLDRPAFIAMVKQVFSEQAGIEPAEVEMTANAVAIADNAAEKGVKTRLDGYASALGKSAYLMSLKCGCDAAATLKSDRSGSVLLQARCGPSFNRPQVGLP